MSHPEQKLANGACILVQRLGHLLGRHRRLAGLEHVQNLGALRRLGAVRLRLGQRPRARRAVEGEGLLAAGQFAAIADQGRRRLAALALVEMMRYNLPDFDAEGFLMSVPSPLQFCAHCGAVLGQESKFCSTCGSPASATVTGLLVPNHLLNERYRVQRRVGQGGFGAVYQAQDTRFNHTLRAIKEMSQSGLNPQERRDAISAFEQETNLLAGLVHPHLPRIYDYFEEAGRWYLVMDFIAGETLEAHLQYMSRAILPVEEVLDIGLQLASVLDYLHTRQPPIIFRDLKPANVMRTPEGNLYLIDFGIARLFKPGQTKDTTALGSPGYAAPEQYGKAQTTARADIYSLGALLHQVLSGVDPSTNQPSLWDFKPLGAAIPSRLAHLIGQMVSRRIEERPASMAAIRQELQQIARRQAIGTGILTPVPSAPPSTVAPGALQPSTATPHRSSQPSGNTTTPPALTPVGTLLLTLTSHTSPVALVAWSPVGQRLASASEDGMVRLWDGATDQPQATLQGHTEKVNAMAWSPDGLRLASASEDGTVRLWDGATGQLHTTLRGHTGYVYAVAWSPDRRRLASASWDKMVRLWDGATGQPLTILTGHTGGVRAVAWSPDGRHLASASEDGTVRLWDGATGHPQGMPRNHTGHVGAVAWSPDGRRLASASDERVYLWDGATSQLHATLRGHTGYVGVVAWSPGGRHLASASDDRTLRLWDGATGRLTATLAGHSGSVRAIAWSPDGMRLASASDDRTVQLWDRTTGQPQATLTGHTEMVNAVAWSPDGQRLASASWDKTVCVWWVGAA
jgi:WD40 repeat protein